MINYLPSGVPFNVTVKPAGARCNMRCDYCYYLEKEHLYSGTADCDMSPTILERFISDYIASQPSQDVMFVWHGGEALLRPISFYENAIELQRKYAGAHTISNCIQTNGLLLNDEWCGFFYNHNWLVGLSIDGPEHLHDKYRRMQGGQPSFRKVMQAVELLVKNRVEWNILATVNAYNADYPEDVYSFLKSIGTPFIQFSPVVERLLPNRRLCSAEMENREIAPFSVTARQWGNFLCRVFDNWIKTDVGKVFVQTFDATLANWVGAPGPSCLLAPKCGNALAMEHNGDIYSCDHYVFPNYKVGNIRNDSFWQIMLDDRQKQFGSAKQEKLPGKCRECEYLFLCNGECPRNRFIITSAGEKYLNYLCEGYYSFFRHTAPYMRYMRDLIATGYPPANIMAAVRHGLLK